MKGRAYLNSFHKLLVFFAYALFLTFHDVRDLVLFLPANLTE